jgi:hypothetical protein
MSQTGSQGKRTPLAIVLGTDQAYSFHVRATDEKTSINIAGMTFSFMVKRLLDDADGDALLVKSGGAISVAGTFNVDPALNGQRAAMQLADTESDGLEPGNAHWELKRIDSGFEHRVAWGPMKLIRGVHRS